MNKSILFGIVFFCFLISLSSVHAVVSDYNSLLIGSWNMDESTACSNINNFTSSGTAGNFTCTGSGQTVASGIVNNSKTTDLSGAYNSQFAVDFSAKNLSVSFWIYPTSSAGYKIPLSAFESSGTKRSWIVYTSYNGDSKLYVDTGKSGGWNHCDSTITLQLNSWQHIGFTMIGDSLKVYYNGSNVANCTQTGTIMASSLIALGHSDATITNVGEYYGGVDATYIWKGVQLSTSNMFELFNSSRQYPFSISSPSASISFISPTPSNNSVKFISQNWFVANISYSPNSSSYNHSNTFLDLYNVTGLVSTINLNATVTSYNFSGLPVGNYSYNVSSKLLNGSLVQSEIRSLIVYGLNTPAISIPANATQSSRYLNISYTNATATTGSVSMVYYNLTLLNSDLSINRSIQENNALNNSFYYDLYSQNLSLGIYYVNVRVIDSLGNTVNSSAYFNLTRNALLNVSAYDISTNASISNLSINVTDLSSGLSELWISSGSIVAIDIVKSRNYSVYYDVQGYAYQNVSYSANTSSFQKLNQSLYKTNSVSINVYDESSLALITNVTAGGQVNITFISDSGSFMINTTTGSAFVSNITAGTYEVKFTAPLYAQRSYYLTITNRSTQTLNAYLSQSTINLLLTYVNKETGELIENVGVNVYKIINGSWTAVATGFTDITGRMQVSVTTNTNYRFSSTIVGYDDKTFNLNPVIFTAYTIQLTKQQASSSQLNFANINVYVINTTFSNNRSNYFSWQISAPSGNLEQYAYSLTTRCKNITAFSGVDAKGDIDDINFNLSCATGQDHVTLKYNYTLTSGELRSFTYSYSILGNASSGSFMANNDEHYGMGMFERILIVVLITITMAGLITKFSNIVAGLGAGLLIMSYLSYIGFIEWWLIAPTLLVGFVLITSWSTSR